MRANNFEFRGKHLSDFGCVIVNFGDKGLETVDGAEISFNTISSLDGSIHHLVSTRYEDCLTATIQIAKNSCSAGIQEITATEYRELSRWLHKKGFCKLKFLDESHIDLYYNATFSSISRIELDGRLMGLELNIITNSPHAFKEPKTIIVQARNLYYWERFYKTDSDEKGESTGKYVSSYNRDSYPDNGILTQKVYIWEKFNIVNNNQRGESTGEYAISYRRNRYPDNGILIDDGGIAQSYYYVYVKEEEKETSYYYVYVDKNFENKHSINDTSHEEGYIYPHTEITINEDGDLKIHNAIENRDTYIANCKSGEVITMDYPIITSSDSSHNIQNDFNWNFFRVANTFDDSRNDLTISLPCSIRIEYSPIVKVGL